MYNAHAGFHSGGQGGIGPSSYSLAPPQKISSGYHKYMGGVVRIGESFMVHAVSSLVLIVLYMCVISIYNNRVQIFKQNMWQLGTIFKEFILSLNYNNCS